ncbi:MAG: type II toxin-antitoxin system Phd/YefM family antitoxin [Chloroflexi bacterium]|nr:MAG: type II toxin-antitoxin system Phd/YefM family antitoxin [Chloroflexota bacterium]MBL1193094.1 type II toxin-antitoxin system Phd/YefM family antitoxin [Chloroflexota bacterium]NOH10387.1 type II toxin-antitoxin system Phd/YefM family antitoxin [Chloroflexota bacterium]
MLKTASVTKFRDRFAEYVEELHEEGTLYVLRHSEPVAVMLSPEYFQEIQEQLEDLADMIQAIEEYRNGKDIVDADDLFGELGI